MGNVAGKKLKPVAKRTQAVSVSAGEEITDPTEFCRTFGQEDDHFEMMKQLYDGSSDEDKEWLHSILFCDSRSFADKNAFQSHMNNLNEDDYEEVSGQLRERFPQLFN